MLTATVNVLTDAKKKLGELQKWDAGKIAEVLKDVEKDTGESLRLVMQILRYAVAGLVPGVGVPIVIETLGKDTVERRLRLCLDYHNR
jgi:glutamyl/glutaminyl-tRNA synthetase